MAEVKPASAVWHRHIHRLSVVDPPTANTAPAGTAEQSDEEQVRGREVWNSSTRSTRA